MKIISVILLLTSGSCCASSYPDPRSYVEDKYIDETKRSAIAGDYRASYWLSMYYIDGVSDAFEGGFWLRLSAEQNYCVGIDDYSRFIKAQRKKESEYWVGRLSTCVGEKAWSGEVGSKLGY